MDIADNPLWSRDCGWGEISLFSIKKMCVTFFKCVGTEKWKMYEFFTTSLYRTFFRFIAYLYPARFREFHLLYVFKKLFNKKILINGISPFISLTFFSVLSSMSNGEIGKKNGKIKGETRREPSDILNLMTTSPAVCVWKAIQSDNTAPWPTLCVELYYLFKGPRNFPLSWFTWNPSVSFFIPIR